MTQHRKIPRGVAVLSAAVLLGTGAAAAAAQPLDGGDGRTPPRTPGAQTEAGGSTADAFTACRTVGAPLSGERFFCFRTAANPTPASGQSRPALSITIGRVGGRSRSARRRGGPGVYRISTATAPPLDRGAAGWLHNRGRH